ncbi:MAG TPA: nitroreductase family protein [Victivallales bacterium]|nr:nitroreductase family protein [Victivallales bacterium]
MKYSEFINLVNKRYSCRNYLDKGISDNIIEDCLEATRLAPSACNKQPWKFLVVRDSLLKKNICDRGLLPGLPMPWLKKAPVIIVMCAETSLITHKIAPLLSKVQYYPIDIGIAGEHLVLAAQSYNLGTCWIGWFNEKQVKKILSIPKRVKVLSLLSIGYPDGDGHQPEKKSLNQIYSIDKWNFR